MSNISLSEILIKIGGIVLFVVGMALVLSAVGVNLLGIGLSPVWLAVLVGVIFIGAGIWIIRGGSVSI